MLAGDSPTPRPLVTRERAVLPPVLVVAPVPFHLIQASRVNRVSASLVCVEATPNEMCWLEPLKEIAPLSDGEQMSVAHDVLCAQADFASHMLCAPVARQAKVSRLQLSPPVQGSESAHWGSLVQQPWAGLAGWKQVLAVPKLGMVAAGGATQ